MRDNALKGNKNDHKSYLVNSEVCMGHIHPKDHSVENLWVVERDECWTKLPNIWQYTSFPVGSTKKDSACKSTKNIVEPKIIIP